MNTNKTILQIDKDDKNNIVLYYDDGTSVKLSENNLRKVFYWYTKQFFRQDVIIYFEDIKNGYSSEVLNNKSLINDIVDTYASYRYDADGGSYEELMHWTECLAAAITHYENELKQYKL